MAIEETNLEPHAKLKEAQMLKLLNEIGDTLKEKGISLEDMIASGRDIRQEIYDEKYAADSNA